MHSSPRSRFSLVRLFGVAVVAAIGFTACGSDTTPSAAGTAPGLSFGDLIGGVESADADANAAVSSSGASESGTTRWRRRRSRWTRCSAR